MDTNFSVIVLAWTGQFLSLACMSFQIKQTLCHIVEQWINRREDCKVMDLAGQLSVVQAGGSHVMVFVCLCMLGRGVCWNLQGLQMKMESVLKGVT